MVVADTSSVNYAILIDEIEVLHQLYGTISIPPAVRSELSNSRAPEKVRNWIANSPAWIVIRSADSHPGQTLLHLGPGEREAIILAEHLGVTLLIDEFDGRAEARHRGLPVTGLVGALRDAGERGLTDFKQSLLKLQQTTFRLSPGLVKRLLDKT